MDNITDNQFTEWSHAIKDGSKKSYSDFFRNCYEHYVRFAYRYVKSKDQACDLVQEAFIKLWKNREQLDPSKSLKSYMFTIVRNLSLNHIRDHKSRFESLEDKDHSLNALIIHQEQNKNDSYIKQTVQIIEHLIKKLPDRQREAFELSRFEGLRHDEIAEVMKISARTVNNHIVSACRFLREEYEVKNERDKDIAL
ncbi:RNA polymerase sigma-70 factor [Gracilimonas sp. Q87]|uniref:RNA polymerase sigma-70 factor n=1 Tax=Gracilimonas sp. Q87 TaxID=3384766 RepID=UPI003983E1EF